MIGSRPLRYFVVGTCNTLLSYGAYSLGLLSGLSVPAASLGSIVVGIVISFASQGFAVFGNVSISAFFRFLANWAVMYLAYVSVVTGLGYAGINPYIGGLIAFVPTTIVSYFILRRFVFSESAR